MHLSSRPLTSRPAGSTPTPPAPAPDRALHPISWPRPPSTRFSMTFPSPSAKTRRTPRRPSTAAAGVRYENRHSAPSASQHLSLRSPLLRISPPPTVEPDLAAGQPRARPPPPLSSPPRSQDHLVFAQHNQFGRFLVPKDFMNTTKESAADAAAVTTKIAPKIAARQMAEDAAPAHATKEEAPVQIWPGHISDSCPLPGWALLGRLRPHLTGLLVAPSGQWPPETGACGSGVRFQEERLWGLRGRVTTHSRPATRPLKLRFSTHRRRGTLRASARSSSSASPPPLAPPSTRS